MYCGHRKRPSGDSRYHQYHIQEQLARVHLDLQSSHCSNTASPTLSTLKSRFQNLPTELLTQIFSYLLHSSDGIWIGGFTTAGFDQGSHSTWFDFKNSVTSNKLYVSSGLFLTSQRISDIALDVLYSSNEFSINVGQEMLLRPWLLSIGAENRSRLTRLRFYGIMRTSERELLKIGSWLQTMHKLRRIHYQPGSDNNPKVSTHAYAVEFDISPDEIPQYNKTIMSMYTTKGLPAILRITGNYPYPSIFMVEQFQRRSRLLSLPEPILRKILSFCHTDDRVELSTPFNHFQGDEEDYSTNRYRKNRFSNSNYFQIFLVCKSLSRIMREVIYSSTEFSLQHHAFVVFSDVIRTEDFDRVTKLELLIGQPETERLLYNVQCLKAILYKLIQPSSNIQNLDIKIQRLCVPYLSVFRDSLMQLKQKCEVKLQESEEIYIERLGAKFNDIGWMLNPDIDPNTTWAWGHWSKKWKSLPAIEKDVVTQRRWKRVKKGGLYVGIVIGGPLGIIVLPPIIFFSIIKDMIESRAARPEYRR